MKKQQKLDAKMDKLIWTKTRPTEPGFYFYAYKSGHVEIGTVDARCTRYANGKERHYLTMGNRVGVSLEEVAEEYGIVAWAGPIPEPIEEENTKDE